MTDASEHAPLGFRKWSLATVGLTLAASFWAINTQLGEILPYPECQLKFPFAMLASIVALLLSLAGGYVSWRAARNVGGTQPGTYVFTARMAAGAACLFAFALLLQAAAGLILSGCQR